LKRDFCARRAINSSGLLAVFFARIIVDVLPGKTSQLIDMFGFVAIDGLVLRVNVESVRRALIGALAPDERFT
jgi:hypothetical protein